ncbi:MAG: hypothetical protein K9H16_09285 [Bacteroidales bacterium]|nr:hypothetical protein [Bacteroidales bacterium]
MKSNFLLIYFWFGSLFLLISPAYGQEKYEGVVFDLGTQANISGVKVSSLPTGFLAQTDNSGYFSILLNTAYTGFESGSPGYTFCNNSLFWNLKNEVLVSLFSMDGRLLFSQSAGSSGNMKLSVPNTGYYLLTVQNSDQNINFMLLSNGQNFQLVKAKKLSESVPLYDSSLVFSAPGYSPRTIALGEPGKNLSIGLLKETYEDLGYFNELLNYDAFYMLHSSPPVTNYGEVQSIKVLYDFTVDEIYYTNVKKYPSHYSFAEDVLGYDKGAVNFFYSQYGTHSSRFLHLFTINYHTQIDKYVFMFASLDLITCQGITQTYNKVMETSYLGDQLYFYPNNLRWEDCPEIPMITSGELYNGQNYQPLNLEENYGYLRKVEIENLATEYLGRHDIPVLNGIPNDLSVVSGIITTEFQTALSHINILSHNRQTPNMALKDGWTNPQIDSLLGALVYLKVEANSFTLRNAGAAEANAFWEAHEPHTPVILEKDVETSGLLELSNEDFYSVKTIGGKAANFAELVNLGNIPVPENYFAIPFYYYQQHIQNYGIDTLIDQLLSDEMLYTNLEYRIEKLAALRNLIIQSPLDETLINMVENRIGHFNLFDAFRFRSSTNAEDLEGFNGAGLYDSYSAKKGSSSKTIAKAIRKVWASLWNIRAFDEREYFKIDHHSVAMGVLVHRSFPDEDANGVVVTKNLYNNNHAYTINTQYKEYSIVYPEPGILHDQILTYTIDLEQNGYSIEYLTHSNIPELQGQPVLTDEELYELADYCTIIKHHYYDNIPNNCNCEYEAFAVDIEFKVDSEVSNRKIYIKQVRIY